MAAAAGLAGCGGSQQSGGTTTTGDSPGGTVGDGTDETVTPSQTESPGSVELAPFWTTGEKVGVGTAIDPTAADDAGGGRVWYTLTRGALTGIRFPRVDLLNVRRLDFLVTDGEYAARTADLDRRVDDDVRRSVTATGTAVPSYTHEFAGDTREWSLTVEYVPDPSRDAMLVDVTVDLPGSLDCYAVCRPAVTTGTTGDTATRLTADGDPVLTVSDDSDGGVIRTRDGEGYDVTVALAADPGFGWASAAPVPDPETARLLATGAETEPSEEATGNSALVGRLEGDTTIALGFAEEADRAAAVRTARGALADGVDAVTSRFREGWTAWHESTTLPDSVSDDDASSALYERSLTVLRAAEDATFRGAGVASQCVPWGGVVSATEPSDVGYHYVWARDLYQSFTAYVAAGRLSHARAAVEYLFERQRRDDGFVPQNTFVDGRTRWGGEQLDEVAFPLVMVRRLIGDDSLADTALSVSYRELAAVADYVLRNGPATDQERWEEEAGYSPSTIAAEVAGLVSAAAVAAAEGEPADELVWLATADEFRAGVREWVVTRTGTDRYDPPYYYRISSDRNPDNGTTITLANGGRTFDERNVIDAGFLELVRLGVLPADDPVIRSSVDVVDDAIRVETPHGPGFYRYVGDGYGEGTDGAPYPIAPESRGRLWPLLTAERAEYELAAGTTDGPDAPPSLLGTIAGFANDGGLLPEQVWDRPEPTAYGWSFGEGTGSATPLSWSHAAFVRLAEGIDAGEPLGTPDVVGGRYEGGPPPSPTLDVSVPTGTVDADTVELTGETDAPAVAVAVDGDARLVDVSDGRFGTTLELEDGRQTVVVAAGDPAADGAGTPPDGDEAPTDAARTPVAVERTDISAES